MRKLLLLGGSRYLLPVIREAKAQGCRVITCDYLPDNIAHRYSDEYYNVSITDQEAVLELARRLEIDGVMSFACDPGVVTAAYVAEKLGLPSCGSYESVSILQDKGKFRAFLRDNGFQVPACKEYAEAEKALEEVGNFSFPIIVKPVDSAGSKGVSRADTVEELKEAIPYALAASRCGRFIVEEFIEAAGNASDSECFSVDGCLRFVSFNRQYFDAKADNPYTPAGFTWPASLSPEHQSELRRELQRLVSLLGMRSSVYNLEAREGTDGKAYIMEFSPRGGGNRLCEMLRYCCGADLIRSAVKVALGEPAEPLSDPVYEPGWVEVVLHSPKAGRFEGVWLDPAVRPWVVEESLWVEPGTPVEAFSGANKTLGTLILHFPSEQEAVERMSCIDRWLRVEVTEAGTPA